ncbi:hypothetical protein G6F32_016204 [Rhizopus arrhizus]|nr:hypothetical protein G6F32_016204 [Rhizopus arrhizus]
MFRGSHAAPPSPCPDRPRPGLPAARAGQRGHALPQPAADPRRVGGQRPAHAGPGQPAVHGPAGWPGDHRTGAAVRPAPCRQHPDLRPRTLLGRHQHLPFAGQLRGAVRRCRRR